MLDFIRTLAGREFLRDISSIAKSLAEIAQELKKLNSKE